MPDEIVEPVVHRSGIVEMSMRISKASYNKSESAPMRWTAIDSDDDWDLYEERMSIDLYRDFVDRIEKGIPVPEPFADAICEHDWCGGMPYLSIAHFKAGTDKMNVPGSVESVFIDGTRLKSKGTLLDNEMGRRTFNALREDLYMKEKSVDHKPVRISIGFLDLEHKHTAQQGGQEFTFTRSSVGQICPLCAQGIGGKIYMKGQLIHLAMTRVPVNPRTEMSITEKSMDEITTKKQDAASIIGEDLADSLEEKSIASGILVVRADSVGSDPVSEMGDLAHCYDSNVGEWREDCIKGVMDKYMPEIRKEIGEPVVKSNALPKELLDVIVAHMYKSNGYEPVEDAMTTETVDKMQAGGKTIPHEKFNFEGVSGDVDANKVAAPIPVKAEAAADPGDEVEPDAKDKKVEKSALDTSFESLKALVAKAQAGELDADGINAAFAAMGTEVEKSVKPASKTASTDDIARVIRSILDEALAPLRADVAVLKASQGQKAPVSDGVIRSKALSLNPGGIDVNALVQRSGQVKAPVASGRKLSQIEMIARRSTGAATE